MCFPVLTVQITGGPPSGPRGGLASPREPPSGPAPPLSGSGITNASQVHWPNTSQVGVRPLSSRLASTSPASGAKSSITRVTSAFGRLKQAGTNRTDSNGTNRMGEELGASRWLPNPIPEEAARRDRCPASGRVGLAGLGVAFSFVKIEIGATGEQADARHCEPDGEDVVAVQGIDVSVVPQGEVVVGWVLQNDVVLGLGFLVLPRGSRRKRRWRFPPSTTPRPPRR